MLSNSGRPSNSDAAKPLSARRSRELSAISSAERWPRDIFEVSIRESDEGVLDMVWGLVECCKWGWRGATLPAGRDGLSGLMLERWVKVRAHHVDRVGMVQRTAAERRVASAHHHREIDRFR